MRSLEDYSDSIRVTHCLKFGFLSLNYDMNQTHRNTELHTKGKLYDF